MESLLDHGSNTPAPLQPGILGTVELGDGEAAVSSGNYERSFEADGQRFATVAVNVDRRESVRRWWSPEQFGSAFGGERSSLRFASLRGAEVGDALATVRQGRPLHPLFLWLAGILMVVESLIARRLGPAREPA